MKWAVALTTAPRKNPTVYQTYNSLVTAGFAPTVFAEPGSEPDISQETYTNEKRLGVWHNWRQAAFWALEQNPDVVMTVQDDSLFHPQSREFVESILWPDKRTGYISLYCPKHYQHWKDGRQRPFGIYEVRTNSVWGAMAMVFHPEVLRRLLYHPRATSWLGAKCKSRKSWPSVRNKRKNNPHLIQNSDTAIGLVLRKQRRKLMYISPSLVDHCASHSSIGHGGNQGRRNAYYIADHSLPIDFQVPFDGKKYEIEL